MIDLADSCRYMRTWGACLPGSWALQNSHCSSRYHSCRKSERLTSVVSFAEQCKGTAAAVADIVPPGR